jgi:hypothetical protein
MDCINLQFNAINGTTGRENQPTEEQNETINTDGRAASARWRVGRLLFGADNADDFAAGTYNPITSRLPDTDSIG